MQDIKVRYPEFQFPENPFRIDIINFCYIFIFSLFFFFLFHRRSTTQQIHNISITLEKSWLLYPLSRGEKGWKQGWPILNHTKSCHNKRSSEGGGGEGWRIILEIVSRQLCGAGNPAGPCRNFPSNTDIVDRLRYVGTITAYYLFRLIRRGGSKVSMEIRINNTMVARWFLIKWFPPLRPRWRWEATVKRRKEIGDETGDAVFNIDGKHFHGDAGRWCIVNAMATLAKLYGK